MNAIEWRRAWSNLLEQLAVNARLRLGLMSIATILWIYALLLMSDHVHEIRAAAAGMREELARLQPLAKDRNWTERADEARKQLAALQGMTWSDSDLGLVEANFQDWIKSLSNRTGLVIRDLTLARPARTESDRAASAPAARGSAASELIRARVVVDLNRLALLGFLMEVARSERHVVVDKLAIRLGAQPITAELDLHIVARLVRPAP